jgi:hypothetical protein
VVAASRANLIRHGLDQARACLNFIEHKLMRALAFVGEFD